MEIFSGIILMDMSHLGCVFRSWFKKKLKPSLVLPSKISHIFIKSGYIIFFQPCADFSKGRVQIEARCSLRWNSCRFRILVKVIFWLVFQRNFIGKFLYVSFLLVFYLLLFHFVIQFGKTKRYNLHLVKHFEVLILCLAV